MVSRRGAVNQESVGWVRWSTGRASFSMTLLYSSKRVSYAEVVMFCVRCGFEDVEGSDYCTMCGAPLASETQSGPQPYKTASLSEYEPGQEHGSWGISGISAEQKATQVSQVPAQPDGKRYAIAVAAVIVAAIAVILAIGVVTGWFGLAKSSGSQDAMTAGSSDSTSASSAAASASGSSSASGSVPVRDSVNDYSWQELSQIADLIAAADTKEVSKLAKRYRLVNDNGELDGSQSKELVLEDGVQARVQIIGFAHDSKSGNGKAGITFMFEDCIADHVYNGSGSNAGGWKSSELRSWLNSDLMYRMPSDLRDVIVEVRKETNNTGKTTSASAVTTTADKLWALSFVEVVGDITMQKYEKAYEPVPSGSRGAFQSFFNVWNNEGSQYQLFKDRNVEMGRPKTLLVKDYLADNGAAGMRKGSPCQWWGRSPSPGETDRVQSFDADGSPRKSTSSPSDRLAVAPCFCI